MSDFYCEQVLSGLTAVEVVLETENVLAFYHTRPFWEVHIVVIPKIHIPSFISFDHQHLPVIEELLNIVRQVASKVESEHGAARILTNVGRYQESKHLHFHVNSGSQIRPDNPV